MRLIAKLHGGPHDGREVPICFSRQHVVVMPHPITVDEFRALAIDDKVSWNQPEDFYHRTRNGEYHFDRTVHYDPRKHP